MNANDMPLDNLKVLELGQLLAGPTVGTILGYYGADIIKIEPPGQGDPIRGWRHLNNGTSYWWYSLGRNKRSVTLNLREPEGRDLVRKLIPQMDVLVENFRPGVMENWGLSPDELHKLNPGLVIVRISGYGQTGPLANKPGFASVCEGFSGFRFINGTPGEVPVRPNLSIGDTIAGMHGFMGLMIALWQRQKAGPSQGKGQVVDVALYESMFNLLESVVPEYAATGAVRQPSGSTLTGIVPTNTYRTRDGKFLIIGGNGDSIFQRLMRTAGRPDMAQNPAMADNAGRVKHEAEIDAALANWCSQHDMSTLLEKLEDARVPVGPIYSAEDIFNDPHYRARGMLEEVDIGNGESTTIPAYSPKLSATPGATRWAGPTLGAHNTEIYRDLLGLDEAEMASLKAKGII